MKALSRIKERARSAKRRVVLPEGTEPRVIQAVKKILSEGVAAVTLLGDQDQIAKLASEHGVNLSRVEVVNPAHSPDYNSYVDELLELRKERGLTEEHAQATMLKPLYFGAMLVRHDKADGSVAGSIHTTGDVIRAGIQVLGLKEGISAVSSCFMMTLPKYRDQLDKVFLYADGAVLPNPTSEQLVSVAAATADTMKNLLGEEPRVAFLSFSTKGSAHHDDVDKVVTAFKLFQKSYPDIKADGELQVDAAIVPEIADSKASGSAIAGDANILVFPDLDAGNIAYKLTQRLAGATATGPIIQGLAKPANDLSRGCSVDDIVDVTAIAMLMKG
ncbi:MAG: phosphate acetyltransferase [candidate division Zixibacteria bacterium]|nr:phosphate acetyltransferase [candidate division Zixibacteria bacterium]MDH3936264.1 phosphate acetyltransferase [candidate division Zixibacteria bacterium]MDH4034587.1 phosphate acetyltransferase [candidate division Zixibacteria bacterium]